MKKISFLLISVLFTAYIQAQSPVGDWKLTGLYMELGNGTKSDLLKGFEKDSCMPSARYHVKADGNFTGSSKDCPDIPADAKFGTKWKSAGKNKISILVDDKDLDSQTYDLEFTGNKMRWIMHFPAAKKNPTNIVLYVIEFERA